MTTTLQQMCSYRECQLPSWFSFVVVTILTLPLFAQPTIDNNILPSIGDTIILANDNLPEGVVIFPTKGEQEWDFMQLQSAFSKKTVAKEVIATDHLVAFKEADIVIEDLEGVKNYYHLHKNELKLVGREGLDPYGLGVTLPTFFEPNYTMIQTPISYGDVKNSSGRYISALSADQLPITTLYSLPILPDSVRFISTIETSQEADAWGHLVLPDNSFEVLRERRITAIKTRMEVKVGLFSWRDITDDIYINIFPKEEVRLSYHFYSNETRMPVLVAQMQEDGINAESIEYLVSDPSSTIRNTSDEPDVYAYPNPAINNIRFEFSNLPPASYKLKIFNILGMTLMEENYQLSGFKTIKWDVSKLRKGTYLYSLINEKGKTIATRRLMVIRP